MRQDVLLSRDDLRQKLWPSDVYVDFDRSVNKAMVKLREAHVTGDMSAYPICQTCQAARPSLPAFYGSLALNSLTVRKAVPAMEKLARFYNIGIFEKNSRSDG